MAVGLVVILFYVLAPIIIIGLLFWKFFERLEERKDEHFEKGDN